LPEQQVGERFRAMLWSVVRRAFPDGAQAFLDRNGVVVEWPPLEGREGHDGHARPVAIVLQEELAQAIDKIDDGELEPVLQAAQRLVLARMTAYTDDRQAEAFPIVLDGLALADLAAFTLDARTQAALPTDAKP